MQGSRMNEENGIVFPKDSKGNRRSTHIVKKILASTVSEISPELAQSILKEKKWRRKYPAYINQLNKIAIKDSNSALTIARKGLKTAYDSVSFLRNGRETSLDQAMEEYIEPGFYTGVIRGNSTPSEPRHFSMPYRNRLLSGESLENQIDDWLKRGVFEPSFGRALHNIINHSEWLDLSGKYFVLLGAGSEVGPYQTLLKLGACVLAVDLQSPDIWRRLIRTARQSCGTLILPLKEPFSENMTDEELAQAAGADLITDAPEIRTWIMETSDRMTIGSYAYLDGVKHIKIAMAMDAIIKDLTGKRNDISIAYLMTPSDSYAVPEEVVEHTRNRFQTRSRNKFLPAMTRLLSGGKFFTQHIRKKHLSDNNKKYGIVDDIIIQQGPSYTLAKNIQKWRSLVAKDKGTLVSSNVAPPTTTRSVFNNKLLAAGYTGLNYFDAEAFKSKSTNVMMTAVLINDLNDPSSAANPQTELDHPLELFISCANHGGLWRIAYQPRSVLEFSVCLGGLSALKKKFTADKAMVQAPSKV